MKQIISTSERAEARLATQAARPQFEAIVRAPRKLALNFSRNQDDQSDATTTGQFKLYGSAQRADGGDVKQIEVRDMKLTDLPGFVALVRSCATPLNKLAITGDFGGALVFDIPAKSKDANIAELYDYAGDQVAISFSALGAISTNRNLDRQPGQYANQTVPVPATDALGNRLGRLGVAAGAVAVASSAPAGKAMQSILGSVAPAPTGVLSLEAVSSATTPF